MLTIAVISDTHGFVEKQDVPAADILIHCGDFSFYDPGEELIEFDLVCKNLPHRQKIIVAGQHDTDIHSSPIRSKTTLKNCTLLYDETIEIDGFKFYGIGANYDQIPDDVDVLISNCPPFGILDKSWVDSEPRSMGKISLLNEVKRVKPVFHLFGHVHNQYGQKKIGRTTFVNASICDFSYKPVNKPIVLELRKLFLAR